MLRSPVPATANGACGAKAADVRPAIEQGLRYDGLALIDVGAGPALIESMVGLYKTELIKKERPWRSQAAARALGALAPTPFNISYEVRPTRRLAAALHGSRHIKITALAR